MTRRRRRRKRIPRLRFWSGRPNEVRARVAQESREGQGEGRASQAEGTAGRQASGPGRGVFGALRKQGGAGEPAGEVVTATVGSRSAQTLFQAITSLWLLFFFLKLW